MSTSDIQDCGPGGCPSPQGGSPDEELAQLPPAIRDKVRDHPCYSERAHHHFARLHVAVAPACNIQCNYCNRKHDCAHESRPGVVSEVLKPQEAVRKVLAVSEEIPQLSVVGIAGPGDALANPQRTFETFRRLRAVAPDLHLCLSTNGLALPAYVDSIVEMGIGHVTVTVNATDPEIGARIHPWVHNGRSRLRGVDGARLLLARQMAGIDALAAHGVLVKVNSVAIPGINGRHLPEVSRQVRSRGAFLHNVLPLISDPAHGTYFGAIGQREPSEPELLGIRAACAADIRVMSHCQQCRADAVGFLGEDWGDAFSRSRVAAMDVDPQRGRERRAEARARHVEQLGGGEAP